ncbi:MAG: hypothetical protein MZW92_68500 [Comamonadaceae bacterium]|nr:hypothetical protein [Comamonadaceae bacterium]
MAGNPVDAEDISQEVFLKVYRSFWTFKKGARLGSWLYRRDLQRLDRPSAPEGAAPSRSGTRPSSGLRVDGAGLLPGRAAGPGRGGRIGPAPGAHRPGPRGGLAAGTGGLRPPPLRGPHAQGHRRVARPVHRLGQELSLPGRPQAPEGAPPVRPSSPVTETSDE